MVKDALEKKGLRISNIEWNSEIDLYMV